MPGAAIVADASLDRASTDAIATVLSDAIAAAVAHRRPDLGRTLQRAAARMARPETLLAVVGEYKKGKSQLINALVGERICPVDDDLATSVITVLRHAEAPIAFARTTVDDETLEAELDPAELARHVTEEGNPENTLGIDLVDVGLPSPLLAHGLSIIDTPGVGGIVGSYADAVLGFLPMADAVILTTDASGELSRSEMDFIAQALESSPETFVVETKVDLYPEWRRIMALDADRLRSAGVTVEPIPVSAELALRGVATGDDDLAVESGLSRLLDVIEERVISPAKGLSGRRALRDAAAAVAELGAALRVELQGLSDPEAAARSLAELEAAAERVSRLRAARSRWSSVLQEGCADVRSEADYRVRGSFRSLLDTATAELDTLDPASGWDEFAAALHDKVMHEARAVFTLIDTAADDIRQRIVTLLEDDPDLAPPSLPEVGPDDLVPLWGARAPQLDFERAGVVSSSMEVLRGSYGGVLMLGMIARLAIIPLAGPASLGVGALFGAKQYRDLKQRRVQQHRQEARSAVRSFLDTVQFELGNLVRRRTQELQRELRAYFSAEIEALGTRYAAAAQTLEASLRQEETARAARLVEVERALAALDRLGTQIVATSRDIGGAT